MCPFSDRRTNWRHCSTKLVCSSFWPILYIVPQIVPLNSITSTSSTKVSETLQHKPRLWISSLPSITPSRLSVVYPFSSGSTLDVLTRPWVRLPDLEDNQRVVEVLLSTTPSSTTGNSVPICTRTRTSSFKSSSYILDNRVDDIRHQCSQSFFAVIPRCVSGGLLFRYIDEEVDLKGWESVLQRVPGPNAPW